MTPYLTWFGAAGAEGLLGRFQNWSGSQDGLVQYAIVLGAFLVVSLGAFIWAAFFRRRHRRHHHHSHPRKPESPSGAAARQGGTPTPPAADSSRRHRRRRRRNHPERQLNPTLAQTGGLPPPRSGEPGKSEPIS